MSLRIGTPALLAVLATGGAFAQERPRIAIVSLDDAEPHRRVASGFRGALTRAGPDAEILEARTIAELEQTGELDLVFTVGSKATDAAVADPRRLKVVAALIVGDAEIRGHRADATAVMMEFAFRTQLARLKAILPNAKRVGIVYREAENAGRVAVAELEAPRHGLEVVAVPVESARQLPDALAKLSRSGVDVILGIPDPAVLRPETAQQLLLFSFRNRIPFVGPSAAWVKAGALYSLDWDYEDVGAQSADLARRILEGAAVDQLPPEHPRKAVLTVNGKTVRHMRLDLDAIVAAGGRVL
jgi:putative ABC transport system substrate-binding protein